MIKFFRTIRQNLLMENKTGKYLKYAIGEIVLVVIGILIALQINTWNDWRKDRIKEKDILIELQNQFKTNLIQLENKIYQRNLIVRNSKRALVIMDEKQMVSMDTLTSILSPLLLSPTYDPIDNEIMTAENLQLIQNDSLRNYLTTFPSEIDDFKDEESEWVDIYRNITLEYLIDIGLSRNVQISFFKNQENLSFFNDKSTIEEINLGRSNNLPTVESILNDRKLEGILANAVFLNIGLNWQSEGYKRKIEKILSLLESEINQ
jgi:hypothetical protein